MDVDAFLENCVDSVAVLRLVEGRGFRFDLKLFAFLKPVVHHISRSSTIEVTESLELPELLIEGDPRIDGVDRSRSFLSLRSPTFSALPPSVHDKSAANMVGGGRAAACTRKTRIGQSTTSWREVAEDQTINSR